jgi:hypothetical protein
VINKLPESDERWLSAFFSAPNELSWESLLDGSASVPGVDEVWQWLGLLADGRPGTPVILPFVRSNKISGWYAATNANAGRPELGVELTAWLGPTWLSRLDSLPKESNDPMARILADRFGSPIYRFSGPDAAALQAIAARLSVLAALLQFKPASTRRQARPVGAIRSDFDRALVAGDEALAQEMILELKHSGRLNEENLRYLEVRLNAGLGFWPEIARNQWLIRAMADLTLPAQVLTDLVEALYRTYVDAVEQSGDITAARNAFAEQVAKPYPKLFASRHGVRSPRVVKAFLFFEQLQTSPDAAIISELLELLPLTMRGSLIDAGHRENAVGPTLVAPIDAADEAFDDGQVDRAFEFYLRLPPSRKTVNRLVTCVGTIGTHDARNRFLLMLDGVSQTLIGTLSPQIEAKIESLRQASSESVRPSNEPAHPPVNPWISWAEQLQLESGLADAERNVQSAWNNWDASEIRENSHIARSFADAIGGLGGQAAVVARAAVPQMFESFFPADVVPTSAAKPIASLLFMLIAIDEALSRADLDLLAQLTTLLIGQGLSSSEYVSLIDDLEDVQKRINSYTYLPWSLDLAEALMLLPSPSDAAREARLRFFLLTISQASGFAHRLVASDLLPIQALARDHHLAPEALAGLWRQEEAEEAAPVLPVLTGKTIGIYTLEQGAGSRAKAALGELFPGCNVIVNSDTVATTQLTNLAKRADLFVFAWRSSSHQAFYCVKDALRTGEPIWVPGKGTASILRAVLERLSQ